MLVFGCVVSCHFKPGLIDLNNEFCICMSICDLMFCSCIAIWLYVCVGDDASNRELPTQHQLSICGAPRLPDVGVLVYGSEFQNVYQTINTMSSYFEPICCAPIQLCFQK